MKQTFIKNILLKKVKPVILILLTLMIVSYGYALTPQVELKIVKLKIERIYGLCPLKRNTYTGVYYQDNKCLVPMVEDLIKKECKKYKNFKTLLGFDSSKKCESGLFISAGRIYEAFNKERNDVRKRMTKWYRSKEARMQFEQNIKESREFFKKSREITKKK